MSFDIKTPNGLKEFVAMCKKDLMKECKNSNEICAPLEWVVKGKIYLPIYDKRRVKIVRIRVRFGAFYFEGKEVYGYRVYVSGRKYASIILPYLGAPIENAKVIIHKNIKDIIREKQ